MNLEESNSFIAEEEKNEKRKKGVIVSIIVCIILIIILLGLIFIITQQDASTLKMFINGNQIKLTSTLFREVDGKDYINIKEISQMLGYTYTKGEYEKYNEDEQSCYITNDYEIVALSSDSNSFTKYSEFTAVEPIIAEFEVVVKSEKGESQKYNLDSPIKYIDNAIYVPFSSLPDMLNTQVDLSTQNRIKLYTLEQIVANAKNIIGQLKYPIMSNEYENLKAMVYNYAVVGDETYYGVISLETGKEIIGLKYDDITFIPNLQDFLIKASNTVGILAADGSTVIKPKEYDEISVYDEENQLYLVKKDDKYGILNRKGDIIIYADYDEIGYSEVKEMDLPEGTGNYKVLFNKAVPVKEGSKYGLYDIEGNELFAPVYDELIYDTKSSESTNAGEKSVFLIPEEVGIRGIVIKKEEEGYGIYDIEAGRIVIPTVCTKIYSITKSAKTTYYLEYNGMTLELKQYLIDNNLVSVTEEEEIEPTTTEPVEENIPEESSQPSEENSGDVSTGETSEVVE